jgi:hypothetical protein
MMETFRKSALTLPLPTVLAVANGVATYTAKHRQRILNAQLCLADPGTGAGSTSVRVKVNGVAIVADGDLAITVVSGGKSVDKDITLGTVNFPGGALVAPGDVVTVDVIAVPGTTVPKAAFVVLDVVQVDA